MSRAPCSDDPDDGQGEDVDDERALDGEISRSREELRPLDPAVVAVLRRRLVDGGTP